MSARSALCACVMFAISFLGRRDGDPSADMFLAAGFIILGLAPSYRERAA